MKRGQSVKIKTAVINNRKKLVPSNYDGDYEIKSYIILRKPQPYDPCYMILVDADMIGWTVSNFHVLHMEVDEKYVGNKFFDVNEDYFCK